MNSEGGMQELKQAVAQTLRRLRVDEPREQVSKRAGIAVRALHQYESATSLPRLEQLRKLAEAYGLTLEQLITSIERRWREAA